jgi:hypothetical protein
VAGPAAFMSYVRFDDAHDDGQLTAFRERLAAEVRMQAGVEFPIFQDRNDISWGQHWRQRIEETLDEVALLLVIVTPGLFRSRACRDEVTQFREREQDLGHTDLILPVYYVSAREMDEPELRKADDLASLLWTRQYADWRELRFEPLTSPVVRKQIAQLAIRMRDAYYRATGPQGAPASPPPPAAPVYTRRRSADSSAAQRDVPAAEAAEGERADGARTEPPTHVVDAYMRGDFVSVGAAIEAAEPGDRIRVRPGLYQESLVVDKPLEIVGDGPVEDIEIRGHDSHVLEFRASIGRVANLTLRQAEADQPRGVVLYQGRLDLEGCDISSRGGTCVWVLDGADPRLRHNKIHDGKYVGVQVYEGGLGTWKTTRSAATAIRAWRSRRAATRCCAATRSTTTSTAASTCTTTGSARSRTTTSPATPQWAWRSGTAATPRCGTTGSPGTPTRGCGSTTRARAWWRTTT